jgi:hypothetical protein
MRWRQLAATILVGGVALSSISPARAEGTARQFLDYIDRGESIFLQILNAYANGMNWSNTYLADSGQRKMYCLPQRLAITAEQNAEILRQHLQRMPEIGNFPAGLALLAAYRDTFPCPGQAPGL